MFTEHTPPVDPHKPPHLKCSHHSTGAPQYPHSLPVGGSYRTTAFQPVYNSCCLDHIHHHPTEGLQGKIGFQVYQCFQIQKNSPDQQSQWDWDPNIWLRDSYYYHCNCSHQSVQRHMFKYVNEGCHTVCDGDTINIMGLDVICRRIESISGVLSTGNP